MIYDEYDLYGPYYDKKQNRLNCVLRKDGNIICVSYPKYLMERHLNRKLNENEQVHHIDENPMNNEIDNLEVLTRREHRDLHSNSSIAEEFTCPICDIKFELIGTKLGRSKQNRRQGSEGPFCSKICATKYRLQFHARRR